MGHRELDAVRVHPEIGHRGAVGPSDGDGVHGMACRRRNRDLHHVAVPGGDAAGVAGNHCSGGGGSVGSSVAELRRTAARGAEDPQEGIQVGLAGPACLKVDVHRAVGIGHDKVHRLLGMAAGDGGGDTQVCRCDDDFLDVIAGVGVGLDPEGGPGRGRDGVATQTAIGDKATVAALRRAQDNVGSMLLGRALLQGHEHTGTLSGHGEGKGTAARGGSDPDRGKSVRAEEYPSDAVTGIGGDGNGHRLAALEGAHGRRALTEGGLGSGAVVIHGKAGLTGGTFRPVLQVVHSQNKQFVRLVGAAVVGLGKLDVYIRVASRHDEGTVLIHGQADAAAHSYDLGGIALDGTGGHMENIPGDGGDSAAVDACSQLGGVKAVQAHVGGIGEGGGTKAAVGREDVEGGSALGHLLPFSQSLEVDGYHRAASALGELYAVRTRPCGRHAQAGRGNLHLVHIVARSSRKGNADSCPRLHAAGDGVALHRASLIPLEAAVGQGDGIRAGEHLDPGLVVRRGVSVVRVAHLEG